MTKTGGRPSFFISSVLILAGYFVLFLIIIAVDASLAWQKTMDRIDEYLASGAEVLPLLLAEDFHDRAVEPGAIGYEEELENRRRFNRYNKAMAFTWVYTLVRYRGDYYFSAPTVTAEEARQRHSWYFYLYDDLPEAFEQAYVEDRTVFLSYKDHWGEFRSVAKPFTSPGGERYLACIDLNLSEVVAERRRKVLQSLIIFIVMYLLTIPLILRFFIDREKIEHINRELQLHREELSTLVDQKTRDITNLNRQLVEKERFLHSTMLEGDMDVITLEVGEGAPELQSQGHLLKLLGYQEQSTDILPELLHPEDRKSLTEAVRRLRQGELSTIHSDFRFYSRQGEIVWINLLIKGFRLEEGKPDRLLIISQLVHEQKIREEALIDKAYRDSLTGLYNRNFYLTLIHRLNDSAPPSPYPLVLCFIDINGLKEVNDTLGHDEGDRLLIDFAGLLRRCLRKSDYICRIGGDEFILFCPGMSRPAFTQVLKRLQEEQSAYNSRKERGFVLSFAHGEVVLEASDVPYVPEDVIRTADKAMYRDKLRIKAALSSVIREEL